VSISLFAVLDEVNCCSCGVIFAMPRELIAKRREDGKDFFCPNGHVLVFRPSEAQRLRDDLARTKKVAESQEKAIDNLQEYSRKQEIRAESAKRAAKRANQKLKQLGGGKP
jgi:hypothetical protein